MVAADFLRDPPEEGWLDGVEPAWTLLTFESLLALRQEPVGLVQSARKHRRMTSVLMYRQLCGGTQYPDRREDGDRTCRSPYNPATGNLSRTTVAEMSKLIEWPNYDQATRLDWQKVIN